MKKFVVVINPDPEDGGYVATVPSLPGVVGQGETEEEAFEGVKAALQFTLESMVEQGEELAASWRRGCPRDRAGCLRSCPDYRSSRAPKRFGRSRLSGTSGSGRAVLTCA
jgi:antitoxin HicB